MKSSICRGFAVCCSVLLFSVASGSPSSGRNVASDVESIMNVLQGRSEQARREALKGLEEVRNKELIGLLRKFLDDPDEDWHIRIEAMRLLAETREPGIADSLMNALGDSCPAIRWNAARELGNFKDSYRVVHSLLSVLDDRDLHVREAAVRSLGDVGDREAVLPLISYLGDKSSAVRMAVIDSLRKIGDPVAVPFLKRTAYEDGDPVVRDEALSAIMDLTKEVNHKIP